MSSRRKQPVRGKGGARGKSRSNGGTPSGAGTPARGKTAAGKRVVPALPARPGMVRVRNSRVHGRGVFALRLIRKGTRILEYLGDRISHDEADTRYADKHVSDNHTFLFIVDKRTVIDGGVGGNDARFINHGCDPNCESVIEDRRVFIEATKTIQSGEELNYDYQIGRDKSDPPNIDEIFACRCGAEDCRGSMLWPARRSVMAARRAAREAEVAAKAGKAGKAGKTNARRTATARGTPRG